MMNLLIYFWIPLVVTGQRVFGGVNTGSENVPVKMMEIEVPEASETEMYSKYEYGSHVGYKNSPIDEFAVGQHGEYYRRPSNEDSGVVGNYNLGSVGDNNDHPSFVASNIYNSIRDKKFKGGNKQQTPSSLENASPSISAEHSAAALAAYRDHPLQAVEGPLPSHLAPVLRQPLVVPQASYQPQPVLLQDPHTGQIVQSPVYQSAVPLYKSHVAPYLSNVGYTANQIPLTTKIVPHYHQLIGKAIAPAEHETLLKAHVPVYPTPLLKPSVAHLYQQPHLLQPTGEPLYAPHPHVLKTQIAQPQLLKLASPAVYRTHLLKAGAVVPHHHVHKTAVDSHLSTPFLKDGAVSPHHPYLLKTLPSPLYYDKSVLLKSADSHLYGGEPLLKVAPTPLVAAPIPVNQFDHTHVVLKNSPLLPSVLKDTSGHAIVNAHHGLIPSAVPLLQHHVLKSPTGPLLEAPLIKYPRVEATIVPAIEEHVSEIGPAVPAVPLGPNVYSTHPSFVQGLAPNPIFLKPKHPKIFFQKAVLHKPPVLADKAVLKAALSPIYANPAVGYQPAVIKAPIAGHFTQKGYLEPDLPAKILTSQKALVNSIIYSDVGKIGGKGGGFPADATHIELVPSLSYEYSYSLYPKANGVYGLGHHHH